jgi:hypothetical protein
MLQIIAGLGVKIKFRRKDPKKLKRQHHDDGPKGCSRGATGSARLYPNNQIRVHYQIDMGSAINQRTLHWSGSGSQGIVVTGKRRSIIAEAVMYFKMNSYQTNNSDSVVFRQITETNSLSQNTRRTMPYNDYWANHKSN